MEFSGFENVKVIVLCCVTFFVLDNNQARIINLLALLDLLSRLL